MDSLKHIDCDYCEGTTETKTIDYQMPYKGAKYQFLAVRAEVCPNCGEIYIQGGKAREMQHSIERGEKVMNFTVIYTPAEEGGFIVTCPALPGLVTEGETMDEAREMAKEAISGYLEVLIKNGQPIPNDSDLKA